MSTLLFDFAYARSTDGWMAINDVVMGGLSTSKLEATGFATAVFSGYVSLENNGGFASARSRMTAISASVSAVKWLMLTTHGRP